MSKCPTCGHELVEPPSPETLEAPLADVAWSTRVRNAFSSHSEYVGPGEPWRPSPITTFAELCALSEPDLLRMPNIGRKSLKEIQTVLAERGLELAKYPPGW